VPLYPPAGAEYPWRDLDEDWYAALESGGKVYGLARSTTGRFEYFDRATGEWRFDPGGAGIFTGAGGVTDAIPIDASLAADVERALREGIEARVVLDVPGPVADRKPWHVKYDGICSRCGTALLRGTVAVWVRSTRSMHCVECPVGAPVEVAPPIEVGTAGRSAREEHDRRATKREAEIKGRWGDRVGGWVLKLNAEPQSTRAWAIGAWGEEKLAEALAGIDGLQVLHDRRVPGTRGNIDHIVIAPAGVFVVDAKAYDGLIEIRNYGWFFRPDWRLTVGRRDKSKLATNMGWQVEAVRAALEAGGIDPLPPVTPVLCFVDGRWPWFRPPNEFEGVRLESELSIGDLFTASDVLDAAAVDRVTRALAVALPAK